MFRVDNSTSAAVLPAPPPAGTPGFFTDGDPATLVPPTIMPAWWHNMMQEEVLAVVEAAGLAPDKLNNGQLLAAIQHLIGAGPTSGSNANGDWRKAPDGWIEQSSFVNGPFGVTTFAVTFPIPFTATSKGRPNIQLTILDTDTSDTDNLIADVLSATEAGFTCQLRQPSGGTPLIDGVYWSAKGF